MHEIRIYRTQEKKNSKEFALESLSHFLNKRKENLDLAIKPTGQPFLTHEKVSFSLSHSEGLMALACSTSTDVGFDIQKHRAFNPTVLRRLCSPQELENLEITEDVFFRIWTIKEATLKCIGLGFQFPAPSLQINFNSGEIEVGNKEVPSLIFKSHPRKFYFKEVKLFDNTTSHVVTTETPFTLAMSTIDDKQDVPV